MPDVGFRLFGDATSLERSTVRAKTAMASLDKESKELNKTLGIIGKIGTGFGIVGFFSSALSKAQQLRDAARENGEALDATTVAAARYADAWDGIKSATAEAGAKTLGFFAQAGEGFALLYTRITKGKQGLQELLEREAGNAAAEKNLQQMEKAGKIQAEINAAGREWQMKNASFEERKAVIIEEQRTLLVKLSAAQGDLVKTRGVELEIVKKVAELDGLEAQRKKEMASASAELAQAERDLKFEMLSDEEKLNMLRAEALDLEDQQHIVGLDRLEVLKLQKAEIDKIGEANKLAAKIEADRVAKQKEKTAAVAKVSDARGDLATFQKDRSSLTLQELANLSPFASGVTASVSNKAGTAREILSLEGEADKKRRAGDVEGAMQTMSKADELRGGLGDVLKSSEADPAAKLKEALKVSEEALKAIEESVKGKFKNE